MAFQKNYAIYNMQLHNFFSYNTCKKLGIFI